MGNHLCMLLSRQLKVALLARSLGKHAHNLLPVFCIHSCACTAGICCRRRELRCQVFRQSNAVLQD